MFERQSESDFGHAARAHEMDSKFKLKRHGKKRSKKLSAIGNKNSNKFLLKVDVNPTHFDGAANWSQLEKLIRHKKENSSASKIKMNAKLNVPRLDGSDRRNAAAGNRSATSQGHSTIKKPGPLIAGSRTSKPKSFDRDINEQTNNLDSCFISSKPNVPGLYGSNHDHTTVGNRSATSQGYSTPRKMHGPLIAGSKTSKPKTFDRDVNEQTNNFNSSVSSNVPRLDGDDHYHAAVINRGAKKTVPNHTSGKHLVKPELGHVQSGTQDSLMINLNASKITNPEDFPRFSRTRKKHVQLATTSDSAIKQQNSTGYPFDFNAQASTSCSASGNQTVSTKTTSNHSNTDSESNVRHKNVVAMDCEMVGTGPNGADSILARVSIVNGQGECLYDVFVKPSEEVTNYRTEISGVRPQDLKNGKDLYEVQENVLKLLENKILVGHGLKNDFKVLFISHPASKIRDTSRYRPFLKLGGGRTPSLKNLCKLVLGIDVQSGQHSSIEDAQAALQLYLHCKHDWEKSLKKKRTKNDFKFYI